MQHILGVTQAAATGLQAAYFGAYLVMAPWAGWFLRRYGYKRGVHCGLGLFSLGTIFFWPSAVYLSFPGLVVCTFVTASGLAWLEIAANTYITVLARPGQSAFLLNFAQAFNGVGTVVGPLIASKAFYGVTDKSDLSGVQWTYLAISLLGVVINVGFWLAPVPEIKQAVSVAVDDKVKGNFWTQWHTIFGAVAQHFYVGVQVFVASQTINYITAQPLGISSATAANMYASLQASFTIGRFLTVPILRVVEPSLVLGIYGTMTIIFSILTGTLGGLGGIVCLYFLFFFEGIQYPTIFTMATADLGSYAKLGGAVVASTICGGAWAPAALASYAQRFPPSTMTHSYALGSVFFSVSAAYGFGMFIHRSNKAGSWSIWNKDHLFAAGLAAGADEQQVRRVADALKRGDADVTRAPAEKVEYGSESDEKDVSDLITSTK